MLPGIWLAALAAAAVIWHFDVPMAAPFVTAIALCSSAVQHAAHLTGIHVIRPSQILSDAQSWVMPLHQDELIAHAVAASTPVGAASKTRGTIITMPANVVTSAPSILPLPSPTARVTRKDIVTPCIHVKARRRRLSFATVMSSAALLVTSLAILVVLSRHRPLEQSRAVDPWAQDTDAARQNSMRLPTAPQSDGQTTTLVDGVVGKTRPRNGARSKKASRFENAVRSVFGALEQLYGRIDPQISLPKCTFVCRPESTPLLDVTAWDHTAPANIALPVAVREDFSGNHVDGYQVPGHQIADEAWKTIVHEALEIHSWRQASVPVSVVDPHAGDAAQIEGLDQQQKVLKDDLSEAEVITTLLERDAKYLTQACSETREHFVQARRECCELNNIKHALEDKLSTAEQERDWALDQRSTARAQIFHLEVQLGNLNRELEDTRKALTRAKKVNFDYLVENEVLRRRFTDHNGLHDFVADSFILMCICEDASRASGHVYEPTIQHSPPENAIEGLPSAPYKASQVRMVQEAPSVLPAQRPHPFAPLNVQRSIAQGSHPTTAGQRSSPSFTSNAIYSETTTTNTEQTIHLAPSLNVRSDDAELGSSTISTLTSPRFGLKSSMPGQWPSFCFDDDASEGASEASNTVAASRKFALDEADVGSSAMSINVPPNCGVFPKIPGQWPECVPFFEDEAISNTSVPMSSPQDVAIQVQMDLNTPATSLVKESRRRAAFNIGKPHSRGLPITAPPEAPSPSQSTSLMAPRTSSNPALRPETPRKVEAATVSLHSMLHNQTSTASGRSSVTVKRSKNTSRFASDLPSVVPNPGYAGSQASRAPENTAVTLSPKSSLRRDSVIHSDTLLTSSTRKAAEPDVFPDLSPSTGRSLVPVNGSLAQRYPSARPHAGDAQLAASPKSDEGFKGEDVFLDWGSIPDLSTKTRLLPSIGSQSGTSPELSPPTGRSLVPVNGSLAQRYPSARPHDGDVQLAASSLGDERLAAENGSLGRHTGIRLFSETTQQLDPVSSVSQIAKSAATEPDGLQPQLNSSALAHQTRATETREGPAEKLRGGTFPEDIQQSQSASAVRDAGTARRINHQDNELSGAVISTDISVGTYTEAVSASAPLTDKKNANEPKSASKCYFCCGWHVVGIACPNLRKRQKVAIVRGKSTRYCEHQTGSTPCKTKLCVDFRKLKFAIGFGHCKKCCPCEVDPADQPKWHIKIGDLNVQFADIASQDEQIEVRIRKLHLERAAQKEKGELERGQPAERFSDATADDPAFSVDMQTAEKASPVPESLTTDAKSAKSMQSLAECMPGRSVASSAAGPAQSHEASVTTAALPQPVSAHISDYTLPNTPFPTTEQGVQWMSNSGANAALAGAIFPSENAAAIVFRPESMAFSEDTFMVIASPAASLYSLPRRRWKSPASERRHSAAITRVSGVSCTAAHRKNLHRPRFSNEMMCKTRRKPKLGLKGPRLHPCMTGAAAFNHEQPMEVVVSGHGIADVAAGTGPAQGPEDTGAVVTIAELKLPLESTVAAAPLLVSAQISQGPTINATPFTGPSTAHYQPTVNAGEIAQAPSGVPAQVPLLQADALSSDLQIGHPSLHIASSEDSKVSDVNMEYSFFQTNLPTTLDLMPNGASAVATLSSAANSAHISHHNPLQWQMNPGPLAAFSNSFTSQNHLSYLQAQPTSPWDSLVSVARSISVAEGMPVAELVLSPQTASMLPQPVMIGAIPVAGDVPALSLFIDPVPADEMIATSTLPSASTATTAYIGPDVSVEPSQGQHSHFQAYSDANIETLSEGPEPASEPQQQGMPDAEFQALLAAAKQKSLQLEQEEFDAYCAKLLAGVEGGVSDAETEMILAQAETESLSLQQGEPVGVPSTSEGPVGGQYIDQALTAGQPAQDVSPAGMLLQATHSENVQLNAGVSLFSAPGSAASAEPLTFTDVTHSHSSGAGNTGPQLAETFSFTFTAPNHKDVASLASALGEAREHGSLQSPQPPNGQATVQIGNYGPEMKAIDRITSASIPVPQISDAALATPRKTPATTKKTRGPKCAYCGKYEHTMESCKHLQNGEQVIFYGRPGHAIYHPHNVMDRASCIEPECQTDADQGRMSGYGHCERCCPWLLGEDEFENWHIRRPDDTTKLISYEDARKLAKDGKPYVAPEPSASRSETSESAKASTIFKAPLPPREVSTTASPTGSATVPQWFAARNQTSRPSWEKQPLTGENGKSTAIPHATVLDPTSAPGAKPSSSSSRPSMGSFMGQKQPWLAPGHPQYALNVTGSSGPATSGTSGPKRLSNGRAVLQATKFQPHMVARKSASSSGIAGMR